MTLLGVVVVVLIAGGVFLYMSGAATGAAPAASASAALTPAEHVTAYYQAILDRQWQKAFDLQPAASKSGTVAEFQTTQSSYGMTAFSVFSTQTASTEATVVARQDLGTNGIWHATWTFALEGGVWVAKARKLELGDPAAADTGGQLPPGHPSVGETSAPVPGVAPSTSGTDPGGATRVPASETPREFVTAYYRAILDKHWKQAFDMQPAASKAGQTVSAFQQTQKMYGMVSFTVFSSVTSGSEAKVVVRQDLGTNGIWKVEWTFEGGAGSWVATSRVVSMGDPAN